MQKYMAFTNIITIVNGGIKRNIYNNIPYSYIRKILSFYLAAISILIFSSASYAQVFQQNEDVLAQGFDPITGSPDVHGNPNQFGILESPNEGDQFIGFHPGGAGLPGIVPPDSSDVFESFSIPVNLVSGTTYRFSFDIAIGRLTGLTTNGFWNTKNLGDNPGFVRIFGGNGRGVRTQLLHTSITAQPGAPDWVNDSFDFTSLGNFTHLTFEAVGLGGGFNTPYILMDNLQSTPLIDLVTQKTLSSANATPAVGDAVSYNINVTNNGPNQATSVSLTDVLPAGLTFVSATPTQGNYDDSTGLWTIGNINDGGSASLTINALVNADQGGQNITNITSAAEGLEIDINPNGNDLTETINIINTVIANDDDLTATPIPSTGGITPSVFSDDIINGAVFANGAVIPTIVNDGGLTGATINPDGTISIAAGSTPGTFNIIYQICETASPTNCDTASVQIIISAMIDLSITKTNTPGVNGEVDQSGDSVVFGAITTYVLTVTNTGVDDAIGALVTDTIGSGLTCDPSGAVTITGDGVPVGSFTVNDLTGSGITLGTLSTNQSATLSYACTVS